MKSIKKLLALAIIATLVLGLMPVAFAAAPSDVAGTKYEKAVKLLLDLGVTTGYPDGSYKPGNVVTRAEMAAFIVRALGLEEAAKFSAGATKFTDIKAGEWHTGYINVASTVGVIKGYPDGTFKPYATVTYPEAVTMLVRALGYSDADVVGTWPVNYIVKASQLGLSKDVTIKNEGAVRGDIALLLNNTLNANMKNPTGYDENNRPVYAKLISKLADVKEITIAATPTFDSNVENGTVLDKENNVVKTAINLDDYVGRKVKVFMKEDQIIAVDSVKSVEVKTFTAKNMNNVANTVYDADGNVVIANSTNNSSIPVIYNGVKTTLGASGLTIYTGSKVTLIANTTKGQYDYVIVEDAFEHTNIVVTNDVKDGDKFINGNSQYRIAGDPVKTVIVKGDASKLTDIKANDIIYYAKSLDGKKVTILVVRKAVEGKVTKFVDKLTDGKFATINGVEYKVNVSGVELNSEGKFILNKDNEIVKFIGKTTPSNYAVALGVEPLGPISGGKVKLLTTGGVKLYDTKYDVAQTVYGANYATSKDLVTYTIDENGKVSAVNGVTVTKGVYNGAQYDKDKKIITINGTKYYLTSSSVIFNVYTDKEDVVKVEDIKVGTLNIKALLADDYRYVKALVLDMQSLTSESQEAKVTEYVYATKVATINVSGGTYYEVTGFVNGTEKVYTTIKGITPVPSANNVYKFELNDKNEVITITLIGAEKTNVNVDTITTQGIKFDSNGGTYPLAANVTVVKSDGKLGGIGDINNSSDVDIYINGDGQVVIIKLR